MRWPAAATLLVACSVFGPKVMRDYAPRVDNERTWQALAARPARGASARTESVKTIIDLTDKRRVYFIESKEYPSHYRFAKAFLDPMRDLEQFNAEHYGAPDRRFILGEIVHYRDSDIWAWELVWLDTLELPRTVLAFQTIAQAFWLGDKLRYHPVPAAHVAATTALRGRIPIVTSDEIFGGARYQAINPGEAFGTLRFVSEPVDPTQIRPRDIVVVEGAPLDLPACAGVITAQYQAPLSHIAVLSANRHTPDMVLRGAMSDVALRRLEGQLVRLEVTLQDFSVEPATRERAERAWKEREPGKPIHLRRNDKVIGLPSLAEFSGRDTPLVGAKAAQLGELRRFLPVEMLPRAFAVPFYAYAAHLRSSGLDAEIKRMLADVDFRRDPARRERMLSSLRERIERAPIDAALVSRVRDKIAAQFPGTRVRLRSSTNAEDLPGFNGAGLYTSTVVPSGAGDDQLAVALRKVWASVWSFQGFEERSYFGISSDEVGMAVLAQESVDDISAIGVAITTNPYDEHRPGVLINVQDPGGSVTSPAPGEVPEQLLVHTWRQLAVERISSSSRSPKPILVDEQAKALGQVLVDIHKHFERTMDVEFVIAKRGVVIVQARPY